MFGKTVIKTIIYRVGSLGLSFILLYLFTGNITFSGQLSIIQMIASTIFYYAYEKLWEKDGAIKLFVQAQLKKMKVKNRGTVQTKN